MALPLFSHFVGFDFEGVMTPHSVMASNNMPSLDAFTVTVNY